MVVRRSRRSRRGGWEIVINLLHINIIIIANFIVTVGGEQWSMKTRDRSSLFYLCGKLLNCNSVCVCDHP